MNADNAVWMSADTTHGACAQAWPIRPTDRDHGRLKPGNCLSQPPTPGLNPPVKQ